MTATPSDTRTESLTVSAGTDAGDHLRLRPAGKDQLLWLVTLAVSLTLFTLGWLGWMTFRDYRFVTGQLPAISHMEELRGQVLLFDEVLTMSARMSAATGDPQWEARYRRFEAQLDQVLSEAMRVAPAVASSQATAQTDAANTKLVAMENRAFELVQQGQQAGAQRLLSSDEYESQKKVYAAGMAEFSLLLQQNIDSMRAQRRFQVLWSVVTAAISVPLLIMGWWFVLRAARRWQSALVESNRQLNRQSAELEEVNRKLALELKEKKRIEDERDRFFTLSLDMLCIAGMDGYFKRLSPAFNQTLGYTTDELLGRPFLDFVHSDDRAATLAEMEKLAGGVPTIQFTNRYQCQDGSWRWLSWKAQPVVEEGRLYATARDVTELRQAEQALRSSEVRYRTLFSSIDEGFCIIEMIFDEQDKPVDYRFLEINPSFEKQTGIRDALGKRMREIAPQHEEHWFEIYGRIAVTGEAARFQNRAEALHRWYDVYAFRFGEPKNLQVAILFSDITERKATEATIVQLNADLQQHAAQLEGLNMELESFSYSVSHDLRAPLRSIDGFSQVLLEDYGDQLDSDGKDALRRVRGAATGMGELIDALLALGRLNRVELRAEQVDLSALADVIVAELRHSQPDREAEFVLAPDLVVEGDPTLLRAALGNLLGNAWKYTQPRATARIEFGCLEKENETVYFVRDNGVGFDMAYVGKLFGAFQRLHRQTEFSGTGIGLATVQRIIHRHGGRAWAEGEVEQGATFHFTLHGQARSDMARWENAEAPAGVS